MKERRRVNAPAGTGEPCDGLWVILEPERVGNEDIKQLMLIFFTSGGTFNEAASSNFWRILLWGAERTGVGTSGGLLGGSYTPASMPSLRSSDARSGLRRPCETWGKA